MALTTVSNVTTSSIEFANATDAQLFVDWYNHFSSFPANSILFVSKEATDIFFAGVGATLDPSNATPGSATRSGSTVNGLHFMSPFSTNEPITQISFVNNGVPVGTRLYFALRPNSFDINMETGSYTVGFATGGAYEAEVDTSLFSNTEGHSSYNWGPFWLMNPTTSNPLDLNMHKARADASMQALSLGTFSNLTASSVTYTMTPYELNKFKDSSMQGPMVGLDAASSRLSYDNGSMYDTNLATGVNNYIIAKESNHFSSADTIAVTNFTASTSVPTFIGWEWDSNRDNLHLRFSEPVMPTSFTFPTQWHEPETSSPYPFDISSWTVGSTALSNSNVYASGQVMTIAPYGYEVIIEIEASHPSGPTLDEGGELVIPAGYFKNFAGITNAEIAAESTTGIIPKLQDNYFVSHSASVVGSHINIDYTFGIPFAVGTQDLDMSLYYFIFSEGDLDFTDANQTRIFCQGNAAGAGFNGLVFNQKFWGGGGYSITTEEKNNFVSNINSMKCTVITDSVQESEAFQTFFAGSPTFFNRSSNSKAIVSETIPTGNYHIFQGGDVPDSNNTKDSFYNEIPPKLSGRHRTSPPLFGKRSWVNPPFVVKGGPGSALSSDPTK
jgi:hypothetical protein